MLNDELKSKIKAHALKEFPNECCGLILSEGIVECRNNAEDTKSFFSINEEDYLRASLQGEIVGCYHSHCSENETFSEFDKLSSERHKLPFVLYNVVKNKFDSYHPLGNYIGRNFEIGKFDCLTLIQEYYKKELGIGVKNYSRENGWHKNSPHYYDTEFANEGFLNVDCLKKHDLILFKMLPSIPHAIHAAIYLGNGYMIHNRRGSGSVIEPYSEPWKRRTMMTVRHKNLL